MIESICSQCGNENNDEMMIDWAKDGLCPVTCGKCQAVYVVDINVESEDLFVGEEDHEDHMSHTPLKIGTKVTVDNNEHILNKEEGVIIEKDHFHYRIQFSNKNNIMYLPHHWVKEKD